MRVAHKIREPTEPQRMSRSLRNALEVVLGDSNLEPFQKFTACSFNVFLHHTPSSGSLFGLGTISRAACVRV